MTVSEEEPPADLTADSGAKVSLAEDDGLEVDDDVRVAVIGNVDSGKSTLIGVLASASLDDGRGSARSLVLRHRHEKENGRTSAATVELLGFGSDGSQARFPRARRARSASSTTSSTDDRRLARLSRAR